ncbi:hypothetical protein, partial [Salmonella sp. SAL4456]|uniref:hypothetical protein n=1 Tax=Salmonella sp. SAL4456 TaxID=3159911 RepID=UPI00397E28DC
VEIDSVIRGAAELVASLNQMSPSLRKAADRLDGVLDTADMRQVARDVSSLIKDSNVFVNQVSRAFTDSSQDTRVLLHDLRVKT